MSTNPRPDTGSSGPTRANHEAAALAGGDRMGPDLYGVTKRREEGWLVRWWKKRSSPPAQ